MMFARYFPLRTFATLPKSNPPKAERVISCKNRKLDHYENTKYDKLVEIPLASKGWANRKSKGDFFKIHPLNSHQGECIPFSAIGIQEALIESLQERGINQATPFQAKAIPIISDREHIMLAAETGCGKTISYLLPIFQHLLRAKESKNTGSEQTKTGGKLNKPKALVLTPNRELVYQIGDVAQQLSKNTDIKVKTIVGGHTKGYMLDPHFEQVDILISTPGVIGKLSTVGIYRLDEVELTVLDEADTLLDDSFIPRMTSLIKRVSQSKFILVSATLPKRLPDILHPIEPYLTRLISDDLHRPLSNIQQTFLRLLRADKPSQLLSLTKMNRQPMLVFTNRNKTCDWLAMFLRENGVSCSNINGDMNYDIRVQEWNKFVRGENMVLSSTDVGSRGLDTTQVQHVLNYDFPLYAADYLHRVGRVGRLGSVKGSKVTNFVSGPEEVRLVQQIELAVRRHEPLMNVDGNITAIVQKKIEKGMRQAM